MMVVICKDCCDGTRWASREEKWDKLLEDRQCYIYSEQTTAADRGTDHWYVIGRIGSYATKSAWLFLAAQAVLGQSCETLVSSGMTQMLATAQGGHI